MGIVRKQSALSSIYNYSGIFLGVISTVLIFPKILTTQQFGLINLLLSIPLFFSEFCNLGFGSTLIRIFPVFKTKDNKNNGLLFLTLLVSLIGFILFLFLFPYVEKRYILKDSKDIDFIKQFIFLFLPMTFFYLYMGVLDVYVRFSILNNHVYTFAKEFLLKLLILVGAICYFFNLLTYNSLVYYVVLIHAIPILILINLLTKNNAFFIKPKLSFIDKKLFIKIIRLCAFTILFGLASSMLSSFDKLIIQKYLGLEQVAIFSATYIFGTLVSVPMRIIHRAVTPILRDAFYNNKPDVIKDIYYKSCLNQTIIAIFLVSLVWLNIDSILSFLPPKYELGKYVILWICVGNFFDMLTGCNDALIGTSKYYLANSLFTLLIAVLYYFSANYLTPIYGIEGTSIAFALSFFAFNIMRYLFIMKAFSLQPFNLNTLKIIVIGVIAFSITYFIPKTNLHIFNLFLTSSIFIVLYLIPIIFYNCSTDINSFISTNFEKFFNKKLNL